VRKAPLADAHALIGNYQRLGHLEAGSFVVLKPQRAISHYSVDLASRQMKQAPRNEASEEEAIGYYQSAHYLYVNRLYRSVTPAEVALASRADVQPAAAAAGAQ
jgi:hypothetical protein